MKRSRVKYIKPANTLKKKAGYGGLQEALINKASVFMDNFKLDFKPDAMEFINKLETARKEAQKKLEETGAPLSEIDDVLEPVMQLKANGGMFHYKLITDIADICLQFIEAINTYDKEALSIVEAHEKTLRAILEHNLKGDGGEDGYNLVIELHTACQRYFKKHKNA